MVSKTSRQKYLSVTLGSSIILSSLFLKYNDFGIQCLQKQVSKHNLPNKKP